MDFDLKNFTYREGDIVVTELQKKLKMPEPDFSTDVRQEERERKTCQTLTREVVEQPVRKRSGKSFS